MTVDVRIRPEGPADRQAVLAAEEAAFGDALIPRLVELLHQTAQPLSFVAEAGGRIVGHTMLVRARLDAPARLMDTLVLSPLGVVPDFQGRGVGTALIRHALAAADAAGHPLVFLEGAPGYYGSRGFESASDAGFRAPSLRIPDRAFQVARLAAWRPWMSGTLVYPDAFWALDCVGLRDPAAVAG